MIVQKRTPSKGVFYYIRLRRENIYWKGGRNLTQEELRSLYKKRLEREKQTYISKMVKIDPSILSKFKTGKIDLYPDLFSRLEDYLTNL